ncbi:scarecrow-like protein 18 [Ricinus communis]|uniref:DELLA protein RGL2, putative n=1 Tax=Ricinus communis TaxID=3988 RepID=B9RZP5_RICCO|nr:scarecrow-like protein 18 [Ricinus communis]EEF43078.1 DELLA protein RGL2, putative [Ricinus communis]|eukprot:XP_025013145.1 scarecrow-like protein 18 [Ricinus communis]
MFNFQEVQDCFSSKNRNPEIVEEANGEPCYGTEDSEESVSNFHQCSDTGFYKDNSSKGSLGFLPQQQEAFLDFGPFDDTRYNILSPPLQTCLKEIEKFGEIKNGIQDHDQTKKTNQKDQLSSTSLKLLKRYVEGLKRLNSERIIKPINDTPSMEVPSQELSTEKIVRVAGERFIQTFTRTVDIVSMLDNPFDLSFSGLSVDEAKKVELAELLLLSAEKVGNQQYERASILLNQCDRLSSSTGNAVERVVHYFCKALRERIDRETGKSLGKQHCFNIDEAIMAPSSTILASYQEVPFSQVAHFAGIQAIVENVTDAKRIHVIDLGIRVGVQWTGLMQALVSDFDCNLELLKITAVGTTSKHLIKDTGKRLTSFAESISLPFAFNIVMVSDMLDLTEDQFELDSDQTVVVYCEYLLRSLISLPDRLNSVMKVIRILNPSITVVTEPEYNSTSSSFVNRFIEALFYFSAYFDCLESCMKDNSNRMILESLHFGEGIKNIVATEGKERKIRNAKLDAWRAFFTRFGMLETELSTSSLCQAKLIAKKFACGNACTLSMDGKSLLIGWKGTPMHSLSAWKFI